MVTHLQANFLHRWSTSSLDYLGIKLTPSCSTLFVTNYYPLLRPITALMQSWQFPSLSWICRMHAIKDGSPPKNVILFQDPTSPSILPALVPAKESFFYLGL